MLFSAFRIAELHILFCDVVCTTHDQSFFMRMNENYRNCKCNELVNTRYSKIAPMKDISSSDMV